MQHRLTKPTRLAAPVLAAAFLVGCTAAPESIPDTAPATTPIAAVVVPIFQADDAAEKAWRKVTVWGQSKFRLVALDDEVVIRAETDGSSAALVRRVDIDPEICPEAEWTWRVDEMPDTADLSSRESEDVAASIFFAFGDPGAFTNPDQVPTLRYAWATETNPVGDVVDSPYFPGIIRTVVVRSGRDDLGNWVTERRNLVEDFEFAFGEAPDSRIEIVAIFTDSDHGNGAAVALYRQAEMLCSEAPEGPSIF